VQSLASLLQGFGHTVQAESRCNKLLMKIVRYDPDTMIGFKDKFKAVMGEQTIAWPLMKPLVQDVRLDNCIFLVSSALSLQKATASWMRQRNADWAAVDRPLMHALGGGSLQYAGMIKNALGLDNAEARVNNCIAVNHYIHLAGQKLDMNVRTMKGMDTSMPNPAKPFIGQMVMAAYANDAGGFSDAWRSALAESIQKGHSKAEALDYVQRSFESYHPLKSVSQSPPTQKDYQKGLAQLNDNERFGSKN
jgi:hypothetical protein